MPEEQELVVPGRKAPALGDMLNADGNMKTSKEISPIPDEELAAAAGIDSESEEEPESESEEVAEEFDPNEIVEITDENLVGKTPDELAKMDLAVLKMLAKNAQIVPLAAKSFYLGGSPDDATKTFTGADGKPLTGDALIEKGFEVAGYSDLQKMLATANKLNN